MRPVRKQYLTHKKFQFRMLGVLLSIVFLATLISILSVHYFTLSSIVNISWKEETGITPTEEMINASIKSLIIVIPIIFIVLTLIVILLSHRIAGPLIRLKQIMGKVGKGDFSVMLKFRKNDEIHDVADSFNEMIEGLKEKYGEKNKDSVDQP